MKNNLSSRLKKIFFISIFLLLLTCIVGISYVFAQTDAINSAISGLNTTAQTAQLSKPGDNPNIVTNVNNIIGYALSLIGIIFLILIIVSGIQWMTAGGNEDAVKKSKRTITNSILGIVIIGAAYAITRTVFDIIAKNIGT